MPSFVGTEMSLLPTATPIGSFNGTNDWTFKYAPGTRLDCAVYGNSTGFGNATDCATVAKNYNVTVADLQNWNPSLSSQCSLSSDYTYCVQRLLTNATDITPACVAVDRPDPGTTCEQYTRWWALDPADFAEWNPSVGANCENWAYGNTLDPSSFPVINASRLGVLCDGRTLQAIRHHIILQPICDGKQHEL